MMSSTILWSLLLLITAHTTVVAFDGCILECAHGRKCSRVPHNSANEEESLAHAAQSGKLVDYCQACPINYVGVACDIPLLEKHPNRPCQVADDVSHFAGKMCRKPFTEYCPSVDGDYSYCTNGGKCTSSYTHVEHAFPKGLLCNCPPEFSGIHCEFLKLPLAMELPAPVWTERRERGAMMVTLIPLLIMILLLIVGYVCYKRYYFRLKLCYYRRRKHLMDCDASSMPSYSDSIPAAPIIIMNSESDDAEAPCSPVGTGYDNDGNDIMASSSPTVDYLVVQQQVEPFSEVSLDASPPAGGVENPYA